MSRSDRMPTTSWPSVTTTAPIRRRASRLTMLSSVSPGETVTTSRPLWLRMSDTSMLASCGKRLPVSGGCGLSLRLRRRPEALGRALAEGQGAAALEGEAAHGRHMARNGRRGPDHRLDRVPSVRDEMRARARGGTEPRERQEARRPEAPGQRAAEGRKPDAVDGEMLPAAVEERIRERG